MEQKLDVRVEGDEEVSREEAMKSIEKIISRNKLLSMATVKENEPHINTAFYAYEELNLYVLTPPETVHGKNLEQNNSVPVDIHDPRQEWTDEKKGLQIFGRAERCETEKAFNTYIERFPKLQRFASTGQEVDELDSEFYKITPERIKIFDEPRFGKETWVNARIEY